MINSHINRLDEPGQRQAKDLPNVKPGVHLKPKAKQKVTRETIVL
jgi:hypothetical protein